VTEIAGVIARRLPARCRLLDQGEQLVGVDPEAGRLGQRRLDVPLREFPPAPGQQPLPRPGRDEHPDAPPLLQQPVIGQHVDPLGRGRRVDPVERGQLVGGRHPLALGQAAVRDLPRESVGNLDEQRGSLVQTSHLRHRLRPYFIGSLLK
jgi:hypothetical protein